MAARPKVAILAAGDLGTELETYLDRRGYDVEAGQPLWAAEALMERGAFDVVVIGAGMPKDRAHELLRSRTGPDAPFFLFLHHSAELIDKVVTLEMGAADMVDDSVSVREIAARIGGLASRRGKGARDLLVLENATVDLRSAIVMHKSGREEQLSPGQVALIRLFQENPGKVFTRDDLVASAPAENADAFDRSIDSRIVRLRRKLDTEAIATIRGTGYRFDPPH